jgi:hypothetical protein
MKFSRIECKRSTEKVRRERITLFNKANNLGSNGASVYVIVEYIGKLFIYNSRSDKEWPPSDAMLVSNVMRIHAKDTILIAKRRDYPVPERSFPDDIRRRANRIKARSRAKRPAVTTTTPTLRIE